MRKQKSAWGMFMGLALAYFSLSPLSIWGMGYMTQFSGAAEQIIHNIGHLAGLNEAFTPIAIPHNGMVEVLFELPFVLPGHWLGGSWLDRLVSIEPVLTTAGICTLIFAWTRRITESEKWAYVLTLAAAFTTMLWPYAYIGLETTQSFFLLLTAYLVLGSGVKSKGRTIGVALCAAVAVSVKVGGVLLVPAVIFLVYDYCRRVQDGDLQASWLAVDWGRFAAITSLVAGVFLANHYLIARSPTIQAQGGAGHVFEASRTTPVEAALNALSMLVSTNKGLLIYCPVLLLAFFCLPLAWNEDRRIVAFALLALCGMVAGFSMTFFWSDEVWGPRYLLEAVAPLMMCLAFAKRQVEFEWRGAIPLGVCMALGLGISFLGAFFWYHSLHVVAMRSEPITLEQMQYAPEWNPIRFDLQLLRLWANNRLLGQDADQMWPPQNHKWYPAAWFPERKIAIAPVDSVSLRDYAIPQPFLFPPGGIGRRGRIFFVGQPAFCRS
jgi:hypothetical protein